MTVHYDNKPWEKTYPDWFAPIFPEKAETVLAKFQRSAASAPKNVCIQYFNSAYSYAEVESMSLALAAALADKGIGAGDRVMFVLQNIPQSVIASLAVWLRGGIVLPVNPMYTTKDLIHLLEDSGAKLVICEEALFEKTVKEAAGERPVITTSPLDLLRAETEIPGQLKNCRKTSQSETQDFMTLIDKNTGRSLEAVQIGPANLAYLVYTSGTTGPPKGAMISHANIDHNCYVYTSAARLDASDAILAVAPLFHVTGIVAHQAIAFHLGIPMVLFNRFDANDALRLIERYRVTFTVASITVYIALLEHPELESFDISHFVKAYSGGAPVSPGTVKKFQDAMGLTIYNVYGLTESTSPATITPLGMDGPVDEDSGALSVGLIIPGVEAWVADVDQPETFVAPGEEGELVLRGPNMVKGYWKKPEESEKAIQDGRFYTGDVAKIDEKGWCYIVDRKKDLINVSGFKVWPRDVEDALYQHPGVKEAAVVGIPDSYRGETVKAFVSLTEDYAQITPDELITFCKERLAAYKYPREVEIMDVIPKTMTGKILRRELRNL
ncbi:class I adenylate-forming enzyme family protein [Desulfotignum phosphitoxidans]|uniref:Long-chain-fatty-acid--CoA ligase LcfA n=1 Tax=Desulfotignum phosphitoxidans DSM 13687 TaxID=1286635 RepID=S0G1Y4_9BACT|nr:AMP-binding protein [Desulfotignum phosphitoxidans]EMS80940.1 long-chain-fatty-acid--CoA ligase LcfA [Desulfotignum phosphitoxidans DSM 13687]